MPRKTVYTHRARVVGIRGGALGKEYWAPLRKVGKWWETKEGRRRFDKFGVEGGSNHRWRRYNLWRLEIETLERIR